MYQILIKQLFIKFKVRNKRKKRSIRFADQVSADDEVLIGRNDKLIPVKVITVSSLIMQGNYILHKSSTGKLLIHT